MRLESSEDGDGSAGTQGTAGRRKECEVAI